MKGSLKNRVRWGFGGILILFAVATLLAFAGLLTLRGDLRKILSNEVPTGEAINQMTVSLLRQTLLSYAYTQGPSFGLRIEIIQERNNFEKIRKTYQTLEDPDQLEVLERVLEGPYRSFLDFQNKHLESQDALAASLSGIIYISQKAQILSASKNTKFYSEVMILADVAVHALLLHEPTSVADLQARTDRLKAAAPRADPEAQVLAEMLQRAILTAMENRDEDLSDTRQLLAAEQEILSTFDQNIHVSTQAEFEELQRDSQRASTLTVFGLLVFFILALALSLVVARSTQQGIMGPIEHLIRVMGAVAAGNRAERAATTGGAEFNYLAEQFNSMVSGLDEAERQLKTSNAEQRVILDTIPVGLLTIDQAHRIGPEYSSEAASILNRPNLAGLNFADLLFGAEQEAAEGRQELERYLKQLFENTTADVDFLEEINPVADLGYRPRLAAAANQEKRLRVTFNRVYIAGTVTRLMVSIEDRTAIVRAERALEAETKARKQTAASMHAIMSLNPALLRSFFEEARSNVTIIRSDLKRVDNKEFLNDAFRRLHGLKGSAGSFGIDAIAEIAHEAEDILVQMRSLPTPPSNDQVLAVNKALDSIIGELDSFETFVAKLRDFIDKLGHAKTDKPDGDLRLFVEYLPLVIGQLEKKLHKEIRFSYDLQTEAIPHFQDMKNVILHLIRNAADHGLEDSYERLFSGKERAGRINLVVKPRTGKTGPVTIEVQDDGRGIDYKSIERKAMERGLLPKNSPPSDKAQLLSLLFRPGFSTKEGADSVSGRGVGLDLVRNLVSKIGGSISVVSEAGAGTRFIITVPA